MPVLKNPKHERFAQYLAQGKSASEAYVLAGYKANDGNASTLKGNQKVEERVQELLNAGAAKAGVTVERVMSELAKIGFADIRKAIKWTGTLVTEEDNDEGGEVLVIKNTVTNNVRLVSSEEIDDETAAAISEISQNAGGSIRLKMYDKRAALVDLGKHLGMFKEDKQQAPAVTVIIQGKDASIL
jgi:phage terminase small subunit